jgi:hypothetical protein
MADSALLKIDRAAKHIDEINKLISEMRPFGYVIKTNTKTGDRSAFPKKNEPAIDAMAVIVGDVVHNLRSALDHAYWTIVCGTERERFFSIFPRRLKVPRDSAVQFPFAKEANTLDGSIRQRFAHYVGTGFYCALRRLKPHGPPGGNDLLYLIHEMNIVDKHKLLIPTGDYTKGLTAMIRQVAPDFPYGMDGVGWFNATFNWTNRNTLPDDQLGLAQPSQPHIFERELDIPVGIILHIGTEGPLRPLIPTLHTMVDTARQTISIIREDARGTTNCQAPWQYAFDESVIGHG